MKEKLFGFFATRLGIITAGATIGVLASLLQKLGNPPNMGVCVACFQRDIAGAIGLHRFEPAQYIRPEIIGFVLGSLLSALLFKEFRPRAGSSPMTRFILGMFTMIGALIFLGCPWRAILRTAGGDMNALFGIGGFIAGIWIGTIFLKSGYNLGRSQPTFTSQGFILPIIMVFLLIANLLFPQVPGESKSGILFYSTKGPGSMHAPFAVSLSFGILIGFLAQRSRFCVMGGIRDFLLFRQKHLLSGILAFFLSAFLTNLAFDQFKLGFGKQPIAHTMQLWNFTGMVLVGLASTLAGGCPGRQVFLAGEGDGDAAIFVLGMIVGAAIAHNFSLVSSPDGIGRYGAHAALIGLICCLLMGFTMRKKNL